MVQSTYESYTTTQHVSTACQETVPLTDIGCACTVCINDEARVTLGGPCWER